MTGGGTLGVPPGDDRHAGRRLRAARAPSSAASPQSGALVRSISGDVDGYPVTQSRVELSPGQSTTLEFHFIAAQPGDVDTARSCTPR